jgi:hypothetical protein
MWRISKIFVTLFVIPLLILLSMPILAAVDSSIDSNITCRLTATSPDANTVYSGSLTLNIYMTWTVITVVPFMYFNVSYSIDDGQKISAPQGNNPSFNSTAQGNELHYEYVAYPPSTTNTVAYIDISSLTSGAHRLTIFADGEYNLNNDFIYPYHFTSSPIYFSVNYLADYPTTPPKPTEPPTPTATPTPSPTPKGPKVTILSPANGSTFVIFESNAFADVNFPLTYETNEVLSWVGYSVDGNSNVTVTHNGTMVSVPAQVGNNNLTINANDTFGNWATPDTATFFIMLTTVAPFYPDYTSTPSPSPTQRPTLEPSQTPERPQVKDFAPVIIPGSMIFLAIIVVGLLIYFRKRRGWAWTRKRSY